MNQEKLNQIIELASELLGEDQDSPDGLPPIPEYYPAIYQGRSIYELLAWAEAYYNRPPYTKPYAQEKYQKFGVAYFDKLSGKDKQQFRKEVIADIEVARSWNISHNTGFSPV